MPVWTQGDKYVVFASALLLRDYELRTVANQIFDGPLEDADYSQDFAFAYDVVSGLSRVTHHNLAFGEILSAFSALHPVNFAFFIEWKSLHFELIFAVQHLRPSVNRTHATKSFWQPSNSLDWL